MLKPTFAKRFLFFLGADIFLSLVSLYLSYALRFNFSIDPHFLDHFMRVYTVLVFCKIGFFFYFKIYWRSWRFFSLQDFKRLFLAHTAAYALFLAIFLLLSDWFNPVPRSAIAIDYVVSLFFIGGLRISRRIFLESGGDRSRKKAIIIGATPRGAHIIKSALMGDVPYFPVAVCDEHTSAIGTYLENVRVYGMDRLEEIIQREDVETALIAKPIRSKELDQLFERLSGYGVEEIKLVNLLSDREERLKDIDIEDLLAREPKDLDVELIEGFIKNKKVLITGAGGSIGSEICRQCQAFGARQLILVEHSEYNLYAITEELESEKTVPKMVSVLDKEKLEQVFEAYSPDIVIHAAAYKHVPLCEANIDIAVMNNVVGTMNVIDLSIAHGVKKVVNISSDKAVRPTNVMGATKRIAELYAQNVESKKTEIVSVRFGNVLGSSGSVVPKFKAQIEAGGPVTVTHPEITRYFMLIPEACRLVLQASAMAKGGELFVLDMGDPIRIVDLAKKMIRLYGKEEEVEIVFTGLRPGEKLYEELLIDEAECKTQYESIYVAHATDYPIERLREDIAALLKANDKIAALHSIVPEFIHKN